MVKQWFLRFGQWCKRHAKVIMFSVFSLCLILTIVTFMVPGKEYASSPLVPSFSKNIGPLQDGTKIEYYFRSNSRGFSGVRLLVSTYARESVGGILHVEYSDAQSGEKIYSSIVYTEEMEDNKFCSVPIPTQWDSQGKDYKLEIYTENVDSRNAFTLWLGNPKEDENYYAVINGEKQDQGLVSELMIEKKKYRFLWELLTCTAGSFALWGIAPAREKKQRQLVEENQNEEERG